MGVVDVGGRGRGRGDGLAPRYRLGPFRSYCIPSIVSPIVLYWTQSRKPLISFVDHKTPMAKRSLFFSGREGGYPKYIKRYYLTYSDDGNVWTRYAKVGRKSSAEDSYETNELWGWATQSGLGKILFGYSSKCALTRLRIAPLPWTLTWGCLALVKGKQLTNC